MIVVLIDGCLPASYSVNIIIIVIPTLTVQHKPHFVVWIYIVVALFTAAIYLPSGSLGIIEEPKVIFDFTNSY